MFSYRESSVALLNEIMSIMSCHSINALLDKVNEANVRQGVSRLTWMTINNHTSGDRVFNRSSVGKINRAMHNLDSPQRSQLIELAERIVDATNIERAVIKGRGIVGGQRLTAKQIKRVRTIHAKGIRQWRLTVNRAYGVNKGDIINYIKNRHYSSISCLLKIMSHLQTRNLNRLTEWINDRLPEGMFVGGALLYTHISDPRRLLSEGGIRSIEVAFMSDKKDRVMCDLANRFIKACAVEKFVVLCEDRLGIVARKIIKIRINDIDNWNNVNKGIVLNDEQLATYLEGDSSLTIIRNILASLNIVSLNRLAETINESLPGDVKQINGGALYTHCSELDKFIPDKGLQAIVTAMQHIGGPCQTQLQKLARELTKAIEIERYAIGHGRPTPLINKIVDRRRRDINASISKPDPESYRRTSHQICAEIMKVLAKKHVDNLVATINEGLKEINASLTTNRLPKLSPAIVHKHLKGESVLSDSSLNKIAMAMTVQPKDRRDRLQKLTMQLTNACRIERSVANGMLEDTPANRKLATRVNRLRTVSINRHYREKNRRLHAKRN